MKKIIFYLLLALTFFLQGCAKNNSQAPLIDSKTLIVGMDLSYPPFEGIDKKGNPKGISVELAGDLAKYLKVNLKIENTAWAGLIPGLESKSFDVIISSINITPERKEAIDFSIPYGSIGLATLFSSKSSYKTAEDLKKGIPTIVVRKGTIGETLAQKEYPNAHLLSLDTVPAMILEVSQGKADAVFYDAITLYQSHQSYPTTTILKLEPVKGSVGEWGVGIRKGNDALKIQIDAFLTEYKTEHKFNRLMDTYLKDVKQEFDKQHIPLFFY